MITECKGLKPSTALPQSLLGSETGSKGRFSSWNLPPTYSMGEARSRSSESVSALIPFYTGGHESSEEAAEQESAHA